MATRDFPPRPQGAEFKSVPFENWLNTLGQRQNIDLLQVASSLPSGAKVPIFDPTETGQNKTKAIDASLLRGIGGPGSSTDNAVARWDGAGGDTLQDSAFIVDNSGNVSSFGGQITFPATQSASSDANTLDDYEEGTWTPIDTSGASLSFTVNIAKYTKIGNVVNFWMNLQYPVTASGANSSISLPFALGGSAFGQNVGGCWCATVADVVTLAIQGSSDLWFYADNGTAARKTNAQLSAATIFVGGAFGI